MSDNLTVYESLLDAAAADGTATARTLFGGSVALSQSVEWQQWAARYADDAAHGWLQAQTELYQRAAQGFRAAFEQEIERLHGEQQP